LRFGDCLARPKAAAASPIALLVIVCARGSDDGQRRDTAASPPAVDGANANPIDTGMTSRTHDTAGKNPSRR
jgi:hypothetical protein